MSPLSFRQFMRLAQDLGGDPLCPANNDENIWFMRFICVFLIGLHCLAYILPVERVEVRQLQSLESKLTKLQAIAQIVTEWQKICFKTTNSKCINDNNTKKTWATKTFPGKIQYISKLNMVTHQWYVYVERSERLTVMDRKLDLSVSMLMNGHVIGFYWFCLP